MSHRNRLSYFLVGPDGVIKDWATGSVEGTTNDCIRYIVVLIQKCTDASQLQASLALYDIRVLTRTTNRSRLGVNRYPPLRRWSLSRHQPPAAPKKPAKVVR